jgi:predicted anti-sigma-YlaC factor YlaD
MKKDLEELSADLDEHLRECADCRAFADRLEIARDHLRRHHAEVGPDASFASRVVARLGEMDGAEALVWASARLSCVTVVLALVLAAFALHTGPQFVVEAEGFDYLEWVIEDAEEGP